MDVLLCRASSVATQFQKVHPIQLRMPMVGLFRLALCFAGLLVNQPSQHLLTGGCVGTPIVQQ